MTNREKLLAGAVGLLVAVAVLYFGYRWVASFYTVRFQLITELERSAAEKPGVEALADEVAAMTQHNRERSLPSGPEALSLYQDWLLRSAVASFGERRMTVQYQGTSPAPGGVFQYYNYTIAGEGNLRELVEFLHRFYAVDLLHRIKSLRILPIDKSKNLQITISVEAIQLPGAPAAPEFAQAAGLSAAMIDFAGGGNPARKALALHEGKRLSRDEEEYYAAVLGRNIFGPANTPPKLDNIGTRPANPDREVVFGAKAVDPDGLDKIAFMLVSGPPGLKMTPKRRDNDAKPGEPWEVDFRWRPTDVGEYEVVLAAIDDGIPAKTTTESFTIRVTEPPPRTTGGPKPPDDPPQPRFDTAKFTILTGTFRVNGEAYAWFHDRTSGAIKTLYEGDAFRFGSISGVVTTIRDKYVLFEIEGDEEGDYRLMRLPFGQSLASAEAVSQPSAE